MLIVLIFEFLCGVSLWVVCIDLFVLTERWRRAGVRYTDSDLGEENNKRRNLNSWKNILIKVMFRRSSSPGIIFLIEKLYIWCFFGNNLKIWWVHEK
jgi:hypothetical protein